MRPQAGARRFAGNPDVDFSAMKSGSGESVPVEPLTLEEARAKVHTALDAINKGADPAWPHGKLPPAVLDRARSISP